MTDGWCKPSFRLSSFPVVEPLFSVSGLAITSCSSVCHRILVMLFLISESIDLYTDILMFCRFDGYPDMLISCIAAVLYRLGTAIFTLSKSDCEWIIAVNYSFSISDKFSCSVARGRHQSDARRTQHCSHHMDASFLWASSFRTGLHLLPCGSFSAMRVVHFANVVQGLYVRHTLPALSNV